MEKIPLGIKIFLVIIVTLIVIFISAITSNEFYKIHNPSYSGNICLTVSPSYLLDCYINGTHIQVNSNPRNLKTAENKYGCEVNKTYNNFNLMYCSTPSNYTKYKIGIKEVVGNV